LCSGWRFETAIPKGNQGEERRAKEVNLIMKSTLSVVNRVCQTCLHCPLSSSSSPLSLLRFLHIFSLVLLWFWLLVFTFVVDMSSEKYFQKRRLLILRSFLLVWFGFSCHDTPSFYDNCVGMIVDTPWMILGDWAGIRGGTLG